MIDDPQGHGIVAGGPGGHLLLGTRSLVRASLLPIPFYGMTSEGWLGLLGHEGMGIARGPATANLPGDRPHPDGDPITLPKKLGPSSDFSLLTLVLG